MFWICLWLGAVLQDGPSLRLLDRGDASAVTEPQQVTARTDEEWAAVWQRHAPTRPRPEVDFSREMVVGVFLGTRPTAGFQVEFLDVRLDAGAAVIRFREIEPPPGTIRAQILTSPYRLAALSLRAPGVRFEKVK